MGSRGIGYDMMINKKFQSASKFGVFSVVNIVSEWGEPKTQDKMIQAQLTYSLFKSLQVTAGFHYDPEFGSKPAVGLLYTYTNNDLLWVVNARVDIQSKPTYEVMTLLEYMPAISEKVNLYSRIQGLYGYASKWDTHARSYLQGRLGLNYNEFNFGAAANLDYYGPNRINKNNFGGFISVLLF